MTETQSFLIEIIFLVPDDSICFIQVPSCDNDNFLSLMKDSNFAYYKQVELTTLNKRKLIEFVENENIGTDFQSIKIRLDGKLLFEGYDGMEFGMISQTLKLTKEFTENFIATDLCTVSTVW